MRNRASLVAISQLKTHEAVSQIRVRELAERIKKDGKLKNPVIADRQTKILLDGHHRIASLKQLGVKKVPVMLVDYMSGDVRVYLRRKELITELIKEAVTAKALNGRVFPEKTTRHLVKNRILGMNVSLNRLK